MTSFCVVRLLRQAAVAAIGVSIVAAGFAALPLGLVAAGAEGPPSTPAQQPAGRAAQQPVPQSPDAAAQAEFLARIDQYLALHKDVAKDLPPLQPVPERLEAFERQQVLLKRLQAARKGARQGDVFTPAMQAYVRQMMATLVAGPKGGQLRASIMDENPVSPKLRVNMGYPPEVPLTTMPPTVLASLPKLTEAFEYRFIGDDFILLDVRAQMIVDFVPRALPNK